VFMQNVSNETESDVSDVWPQIAPLLDTAMTELNEDDRLAIVLRFFDGRSMNEIGTALGANEEAAKKRVARAVEKLRLFFSKRGVVLPAAILTGAISANSVQAAPVGLAKTISVAAMAQGATVGGSIMALFKGGFWKALLPAAPIAGSVFFCLKAEVANGKSPRERQFIARMIWFRFTAALLGIAVPIVIGLLMPALFKQPGIVEYGFAGFCFLGAVEVTARTVYFHRRRRQIQIEDGTWEESDSAAPAKPDEFLGDLMGKTSKANRYAAIAMVFGFVGALIVMPIFINRMLAGGHWVVALLGLAWVVVRWIRHLQTGNWRQLPRLVFDARFGRLAKIIVFFAVMSFVLFDLSWAHGRLLPSWEWAIAFHILVAMAYAVLILILAKAYRPLAARQDSASN
jgi:hypothetical protein